jgi:hypothetical protein
MSATVKSIPLAPRSAGGRPPAKPGAEGMRRLFPNHGRACLGALARRWERTDFHRLNQAVRQREPVTDVNIGKNGSGQVTHDLVHLDQNTPVKLPMKGNRFDTRVDLGPLLRPIRPHRFMAMGDTAFEGFGPRYVRSHRRKGSVNVPRVEGRVGSF